jgi:hypothetical protein
MPIDEEPPPWPAHFAAPFFYVSIGAMPGSAFAIARR